MKAIIALIALPFLLNGSAAWLTDLDQAKAVSKEKHELILLNFSGSDWCSGCVRMHKEIFEAADFQQYAADHLVLVNADFPRSKKNSLSPEQEKKNDALADRYNPKGYFPYTVLLDSDGNVLKSWNGYYEHGTQNFLNEIREADAGNNNR
jgi:thioredoxin-related protein